MNKQTWQNKMFGRYRMLRMLGKGGMGEVWLAEDTQLLRQVAVKLLPPVGSGDRHYLQAFEREARAAASLEHPHILPVHDFGEQETAEQEVITYFITPYISGGSLQDLLRTIGGPLSPAEGLNYLRQAAQAIDYAHAKQVIHRDIKPANMLLDQSWLYLADFGLSKLLTSKTQRPYTYAGSGTPSYMAPEQARGQAEPASDRYSFALTTYEIFTGRLPFQGETPYSILLKHISAEPPTPRQFNEAIPAEAAQAILQGLAKQPADRPATCLALVEALEQAWQIRPPDQSKPLAPPLQITSDPEATQISSQTSNRRTPTPLPYASTHLPDQSIQQTALVGSHPAIHNAPTRIVEHSSGQEGIETPAPRRMTRRAIVMGGSAAALALVAGAGLFYSYEHSLAGATPKSNSPSGVPHPQPGPSNLVSGVPLLSLTGHRQELSIARWDPSGRYLATGGLDATVMVWDIAAALRQNSNSIQAISTPLRTWKLASPIFANRLCWSADGSKLAVLTEEAQGGSKVALFDMSSSASEPQATYSDTSATNGAPIYPAIAWSPNAPLFATPSYQINQQQQQVALWQAGNTTHPQQVLTASASGSPQSIIYDYFNVTTSSANIDTVSWSADGALLAGHSNSGTVTIWDARTGAVKTSLKLPTRPTPAVPGQTKGEPIQLDNECLAWSPTHPRLLAASDLDQVTLWEVQQNTPQYTFKSSDPVPFVSGLSWSSNGRYLAGSYGGSPRIYIWDVQNARGGAAQSEFLFFPKPGVQIHKQPVADVDWSPDGRYIASASGDATAVIWRVEG